MELISVLTVGEAENFVAVAGATNTERQEAESSSLAWFMTVFEWIIIAIQGKFAWFLLMGLWSRVAQVQWRMNGAAVIRLQLIYVEGFLSSVKQTIFGFVRWWHYWRKWWNSIKYYVEKSKNKYLHIYVTFYMILFYHVFSFY